MHSVLWPSVSPLQLKLTGPNIDVEFGGRYLVQHSHREALLNMLLEFRIPTGWPVQSIIEDLRQHWAMEG